MALYGVTFTNRLVGPRDDGMFQQSLMSDGRLNGFSVSNSGSVCTVKAGRLIARGRILGNNADLPITVPGTSGVARLTLVIDLNGAATVSNWEQASIRVDTAASIGELPALVQTNLNQTGTAYELALAVLSLTANGIGETLSILPLAMPIVGDGTVTPEKLSGVTYSSIGLSSNQVRAIKMGTASTTSAISAAINNGEIYLQYSED